MTIFVTITSILVITGLAWLVRKTFRVAICPICAGVALTWLWMLSGILLGKLPPTTYTLPTSILMGGSVVGIAYQLEKRPASAAVAASAKEAKAAKPLLFKILFIPAGFGTVYAVISGYWLWAAAGVVYLAGIALSFVFFLRRPEGAPRPEGMDKNNQRVAELEEKMKKCC